AYSGSSPSGANVMETRVDARTAHTRWPDRRCGRITRFRRLSREPKASQLSTGARRVLRLDAGRYATSVPELPAGLWGFVKRPLPRFLHPESALPVRCVGDLLPHRRTDGVSRP